MHGKLQNPESLQVVTFRGEFRYHVFTGTLTQDVAKPFIDVFTQYEFLVNEQIFACLDRVQQRIEAMQLKVIMETGEVISPTDLQIYPSSGEISFLALQHKYQGAAL